jgi:Rieske Fe-S protein
MPREIANGAATGPSRRGVLKVAAAAGLAVATAGCETYGAASVDRGDQPEESPATGQSGDANAGSGGDSGATPLANTGDIPVGGGKVFDSENVVVTQPVGGKFLAFSAVCTHQGCTVASVSDGTINCPCHGSAFRIQDGSVAGGPASTSLSKVQITVEGTTIRLT